MTYSGDDNSSWPILEIAETEDYERFKLIRVSNSRVLVHDDSSLNGWKQGINLDGKILPIMRVGKLH